MPAEMLHGTVEVLVLKTLTWGPMHGFGIGRWIERVGGKELRLEEGSLYPALYRLERKGWIEGEWGITEKNRRAKYYSLTRDGRRALQGAMAQWAGFARAVGRVLNARQQPA